MDRASGSGVFARDPDALLDLIELELTDDLLKQEENKAVCKVCEGWLSKHVKDWDEEVSQDDQCSEKKMLSACDRLLGPGLYRDMLNDVYAVRVAIQQRTAWRIDGTLREFPKFKPVDLWFDYPTHHVDDIGSLKDIQPESALPWKQGQKGSKSLKVNAKKERIENTEAAYEACKIDGDVTVKGMAEYLTLSERTVRRRIEETKKMIIENGIVRKLTKDSDTK